MRVRGRTPGLEPAPGRRLLLRHADHHHSEATLPLGLMYVAPGAKLLGLALLEVHHWDPVAGREALDRADVRGADLPQRCRRRDRESPIEEEPHEHPLGLQLRGIAREEDPVDRVDLERDPLPQ
jgi:hypothetical protein